MNIYTDGSASPNPGRGGWGLIVECENMIIEDYGGKLKTTNNEMELYAFYQALFYCDDTHRNVIFTDSKYVQGTFGEMVIDGKCTGWLVKQKKNGWITSTKQPTKNVDLIKKIDAYITNKKLTFELKWVKGHNLNPGNERADELANMGRKELN